jgi:hypothetical protein
MQRLIEQPASDGDVFDGPTYIGRVHYHLSVYQHFSGAKDESVPANLEVEGRITPIDKLSLAEFHRRGSELSLHLSDGRSLDFSMVDPERTIRSTGRGLHRR